VPARSQPTFTTQELQFYSWSRELMILLLCREAVCMHERGDHYMPVCLVAILGCLLWALLARTKCINNSCACLLCLQTSTKQDSKKAQQARQQLMSSIQEQQNSQRRDDHITGEEDEEEEEEEGVESSWRWCRTQTTSFPNPCWLLPLHHVWKLKHLGKTKSRPYTISHSVMHGYCCVACVAGFLADLCFAELCFAADLCFAAARCRFFCTGCQGLRSLKFYQ